MRRLSRFVALGALLVGSAVATAVPAAAQDGATLDRVVAMCDLGPRDLKGRNVHLVPPLFVVEDKRKIRRGAASLGNIEGDPNVTHYPKKKTRLLDMLSNLETSVIPKIPFNSRFGLYYLVNTI